MASDRPDQVVYNDETHRYDAFLKTYPTNVGAPAISPNDSVSWKRIKIKKANAQFRSEFMELKSAYAKMLEAIEINELVYSASFSFEPISGETYYLYRNADGKPFLSILSPDECNFDFLGSYRLSTDGVWKPFIDQ